MPGLPIYYPTDCEVVGNGNPSGSVLPGDHREIISGAGASLQLYRKQSGARVLFDSATQTYILPPASRGVWFEFYVSTTATAQKVITDDSGTTFRGAVLIATLGTASVGGFAAASNNRAIDMNGTTKGGIIGSRFILTASSTSRWQITGTLFGSGTVETGFADS